MRKKLFTSILSATLLLSATPVFANPIIVDGQTVSNDAYVKDDTSMIPLRGVLNKLGISDNQIIWDAKTKTATIFFDDTVVTMKIGSKEALVNGTKKKLPTAPEIKNGKAHIPLRFMSDITGSDIKWNASTKTVTINTDNSVRNSHINSYNTTASYNNNNNTTTTITNSNIGNTNSFNQNSFNTTTNININGYADKEIIEDAKNQPNEIEKQILTELNDFNTSTLEKAIQNGVKFNPNAHDEDGWTMLHYLAMKDEYVDLVQKLLDMGANINTQENKKKRTPLHIAITMNQKKMIDKLHLSGASLILEDSNGDNPWESSQPGSYAYYTLAPSTPGAKVDYDDVDLYEQTLRELGL